MAVTIYESKFEDVLDANGGIKGIKSLDTHSAIKLELENFPKSCEALKIIDEQIAKIKEDSGGIIIYSAKFDYKKIIADIKY